MKQLRGCDVQHGLAYSIIGRLASLRLQQKSPRSAWNKDYPLDEYSIIYVKLRVVGFDLGVYRGWKTFLPRNYRAASTSIG
jgi:hypothetical protein